MIKYLIIFGLILMAWCPWLKADEAMQIVDARVAKMQAQEPDLCVMTIDKNSVKKVPFGYVEKVSYDCTITDPISGVLKSTDTVFITFYKGLIGMPHKTQKRVTN